MERINPLGKNESTPLQESLPLGCMNRSANDLDEILLGGINIPDEISKRAKTQSETVILDIGCGTGAAIEERVRKHQAWLRKSTRQDIAITGIGIDINPIPEYISPWVLEIIPEHGYRPSSSTKKYPLMTSIRQDDATTLETVASNSVDIIYSVHVLEYIEDTLRAIEAAWRTLKLGGIMCLLVNPDALSEPNFDTIVANTPGGQPFLPKNVRKRNFIVSTKGEDRSFNGFPYTLKSSRPYDFSNTVFRPSAHEFVRTGVYEKSV